MQLDGARILLTGAGTGIGRALALELASAGAILVLVGRRESPLRSVATEITATGRGGAHVLPADITKADQRQTLIHQAVAALGGLDALINNAGVVPVGAVDSLDEAEIARAFETNILAPYGLVRAALPTLRQSRGRIVMIGSMFGEIAFPLFAGYSASKFALRGLAEALRRELAEDGIRVIHVAPRATKTPAADNFQALQETFAMRMDEPERVANLIVEAMRHDRPHVRPGFTERIFALVQALAPGMIDRALVKQMADARQADPSFVPIGSRKVT